MQTDARTPDVRDTDTGLVWDVKLANDARPGNLTRTLAALLIQIGERERREQRKREG